jgi:hypothetical protein
MDEKTLCLRAREILEKMTLKEKLGQVTQIMYYDTNYEETAAAIREIGPGSLVMANGALAGNEKQENVQRDKLDALQNIAVNETASGIPLLFGRDVIHGHHVVFPAPLTSACAFDMKLVRDCYDAVREEAGGDGINWTFAPMLDMAHDPRWGRIVEGPGEDPYLGELMAEAINSARMSQNSIGGTIECHIENAPAGWGEVVFDKLDAELAKAMLSLGAVKGIEFGEGFAAAELLGSEDNDYMTAEGWATNHSGGILGGITSGMPVIFRCAIRPTPSISQKQQTVSLKTGENAELEIHGRHDPCILPRAVPVIEAMTAIAIVELWKERQGCLT